MYQSLKKKCHAYYYACIDSTLIVHLIQFIGIHKKYLYLKLEGCCKKLINAKDNSTRIRKPIQKLRV